MRYLGPQGSSIVGWYLDPSRKPCIPMQSSRKAHKANRLQRPGTTTTNAADIPKEHSPTPERRTALQIGWAKLGLVVTT